MKYYGEMEGYVEDGLEAAGDGVPKFTRNIEVSNDATIERGMLLSATTPNGVYSAATAADSGKFFVVAATDFAASTDSVITQAYVSGRFHKNKMKAAAGVLDNLELELRRQNIQIVGQKEIYGVE